MGLMIRHIKMTKDCNELKFIRIDLESLRMYVGSKTASALS